MGSIGRSAERKGLTVIETSSGPVDSGRAVAIICRENQPIVSNVEQKQYLIYELTANEDLGPQLRLTTFNEIVSLLLEHRVVMGDGNKFIVIESFMPFREY